jgi:hypothetical protein
MKIGNSQPFKTSISSDNEAQEAGGCGLDGHLQPGCQAYHDSGRSLLLLFQIDVFLT